MSSPLSNPLDDMGKSDPVDTSSVQNRVDALKKRAEEERKEIVTNLSAKRKAKMVPQGTDPDIERERRTLVDKEIAQLDQKRVEKDEESKEIEDMANDLGQLRTSLDALEKERDSMRIMLAKAGADPKTMSDIGN